MVFGVISAVVTVWVLVDLIREIALVCSDFGCNGSDSITWSFFGSITEVNWFWWIVLVTFMRTVPLVIRGYFLYSLISYWKVSDKELLDQGYERASKNLTRYSTRVNDDDSISTSDKASSLY